MPALEHFPDTWALVTGAHSKSPTRSIGTLKPPFPKRCASALAVPGLCLVGRAVPFWAFSIQLLTPKSPPPLL